MKYIGHRKESEQALIKVFNILGYDIYIPSEYCCPTVSLKKGCPIWVSHDEEGNCDVFECDNEDTLYSTLVGIIKEMYPKRNGHYCTALTKDIMKDLGFEAKPYFNLSAVCFDEDNKAKAIVVIEEDIESTQNKGFKCAKISQIINNDNDALNALYKFVFSEYNINKNRGLLISYKVDNESDANNAKIMNMTLKKDGKYYYQFE